MGGGGKIPYPKHVWSPAGGWYGQPANWKGNTAIVGIIILGFSAAIFSTSAEREHRWKMPAKEDFFPSRYWSRQIVEYEKQQARQEGRQA